MVVCHLGILLLLYLQSKSHNLDVYVVSLWRLNLFFISADKSLALNLRLVLPTFSCD